MEDGNSEFGRDSRKWACVLGICHARPQVRFIRVKNRTAKTLTDVIKRYVDPGSLVRTDEFNPLKIITGTGFRP